MRQSLVEFGLVSSESSWWNKNRRI